MRACLLFPGDATGAVIAVANRNHEFNVEDDAVAEASDPVNATDADDAGGSSATARPQAAAARPQEREKEPFVMDPHLINMQWSKKMKALKPNWAQ